MNISQPILSCAALASATITASAQSILTAESVTLDNLSAFETPGPNWTLALDIAGERVKITFHTGDDMLHNFVLCNPGTGQTIGADAMQLGVSGMSMSFIPDSDDVIVHTTLVQPESSQTIYFTVPSKPGDYVCTFHGHAMPMKGILRVTR
jgi:azurin|tara:strand:- start:1874 stop:2326 length:453 start_codon:yes stop_codon:yes gene_type:complete